MKTTHVTGYEVYNDPLFQQLCKKYGINVELNNKEITIRMTEDDLVVSCEYRPVRPEMVDTTNLTNTMFRTYEPVKVG